MEELIKLIASIIAIIGAAYAIYRQWRMEKRDSKYENDKIATKEYVLESVNNLDEKIQNKMKHLNREINLKIQPIIVSNSEIIDVLKEIKKDMASRTFVNENIEVLDRETNLKIELVKQKNEEELCILENISKKVEFMYQQHYKP